MSRLARVPRLVRRCAPLVAGLLVVAALSPATQAAAPSATADPTSVAGAGVEQALGARPVAFVPNRGQTDPRVRYYAVGQRYAFFATRDELMLSLSRDDPARGVALALRFLGRSPQARVTATGKAPGVVNYLAGRHPSAAQTGLSRYRELVYRNLWP